MIDEDRNELKKIAEDWNSQIIEQEGYNPVGVDWILTHLIRAYNMGVTHAQNLSTKSNH